MKLKVKWDGQRQIVDFADRSVSDVTLSELKQNVSTLFNADGIEFQLSLNRQNPLDGEDLVLSEFGLVSGDLVHVLGPSLPGAAQASSSSAQETSQTSSSVVDNSQFSEPVGEVMSFEDVRENHEAERQMAAGATTEDLQEPSDMEVTDTTKDGHSLFYSEAGSSEVNRWLAEPLVMRESSGSAVPIPLSQLFHSAKCVSGSDAVWVAVHCLMLESGFYCDQSCDTSTCMPDNWKRPGYYRSEFSYTLAPGLSAGCCVTGVTLGSTVAVHGVTVKKEESDESFTTDTVHLQSSQYIRGMDTDVANTYRALDRLSLLIKDKICLPLINELATSAGYRENQGLLAMPREVLLRICSCLDAQSLCHLGQTCGEMGDMYRDRVLWRRMFMVFFPEPTNCSLSQDWFQMYKEKTLIFKHRQEEMRQQRAFMNRPDGMWMPPGMFPYGPHPGMMPPNFPPMHMIGGEHDLNPEFAAGLPRPRDFFPTRGGGPLMMQNPPRPNFDPLRVGARLPGMPGLFGNDGLPGGRRGNNLTGSPFFNQGFF